MTSSSLRVGDEIAFSAYEESFIYYLQKFWKSQSGMESVAVIEMSAWIEDLLYQEALKKNHLPPTAHVWSKTESILYFQDRCEKLQRQIESKKHVNWKKVFEQHGKHPTQVLKVIMQEETESKAKSKASKAKVKEEKVAMLADHSIPPPPSAPHLPPLGSAPHATTTIPVSAIVPVIAPKKTRPPPKKKAGPAKKAKIAEAVPGSSTSAAPPPPAPLDLNDADAMDVDLALDEFGFDFEGDNAVEEIKLANEDMWK